MALYLPYVEAIDKGTLAVFAVNKRISKMSF